MLIIWNRADIDIKCWHRNQHERLLNLNNFEKLIKVLLWFINIYFKIKSLHLPR